MEYINLGTKEPDYDLPVASNKGKKLIRYPSFYCTKELPISGKQVGKEITAIVRLRIRSVEKRVRDGKAPTYDYSFDVKEIKFPGKDIETTEGIQKRLEKI